MLKTKQWVKAKDIVPTIIDPDALSGIGFYVRYRRMGMPYGPWGVNPHKLVQVVDLLEPLDRIYNPKMTL